MFFPNYEVIINDTKSQVKRTIKFDEISVWIYGDAKYSRTEIKYFLNPEYKENHNLSMYIKAINDYLISNPAYKTYENKNINVFDFSCIKFIDFRDLNISSNEFQLINNCYPNILAIHTENCTISEKTLIGCLKCNYYDISSNIMSLDSFNGFSGRVLKLYQTSITNINKNVLNLLCDVLELEDVDIDYETFFLTTNAPKIRKLEIHKSKKQNLLNNRDLLFISGFFNLEYIDINGIVENYNEIRKLEKLRILRGILHSNQKELDIVKEKRSKYYSIMKENKESEELLYNYLQYQGLIIQNKYLDFLHKIYVPRLERIKWENKVSINNLEKIKEELIYISKLPNKERKNIAHEIKECDLFDSIHGLYFDENKEDEQEDILVDSRPFQDGGIQYYIKRKKIILDE